MQSRPLLTARNGNVASAAIACAGAAITTLILSNSGGGAGEPTRALPPFGTPEFVALHVVCALPLVWFAACSANGLLPGSRVAKATMGLFAALAILLIVLNRAESLQPRFDGRTSTNAHLVRVCLVFVLLLPWTIMAAALRSDSRRKPPLPNSWRLRGALCLLLALLAPAVYLANRLPPLCNDVIAYHAAGRDLRAWRLATEISEINPGCQVGGESAIAWKLKLATELQPKVIEAQIPLPAGSSFDHVLRRATLLARIDCAEMAIALLTPFADDEPEACLVLAAIANADRNWDRCQKHCRQALHLLETQRQEGGNLDARIAATVRAHDGLTKCYYQQGQLRQAELVLVEALREHPESAAAWRLRLATHYTRAGCPWLARRQIEHLPERERLQAEVALRQSASSPSNAAGCVLFRVWD